MDTSDIDRAHWRLHRMLLRRIVVTGVLVAAILAGITYLAGLRDLHNVAVSLPQAPREDVKKIPS